MYDIIYIYKIDSYKYIDEKKKLQENCSENVCINVY